VRRDALIAARRRAGKSQEAVGEEAGVDRTTIGTWERGERSPQPHQRKLYAEAIGLTLSELDAALTGLPNEETRPPVGLAAFLGMEQSATEILAHEPHVVHGLLQTPDYAAAIARSVGVAPSSEAYERRNKEQRQWRQVRVERGDVALHVVQPEIALRLRLGTREGMAAQMDKLIALGRRDHVTVQVVPFSVGQYEALRMGSISVMTHPWVPGRTVYWVRYPGLAEVEDPDEAANFIAAVEQAATLALTPDESLELIARAAEEWRKTT
jgi:transcriptional regulator with XRE-family HTH domain